MMLRGRAIAALRRHRSGGLRPETAKQAQPKALLTIAVQALAGVAFLYLIIFAFGAVA